MNTPEGRAPTPAREAAPRIPASGIPASGPIGAVVRDALDASVQRLLVADPIARVGDDPEGVHQARVATRRLRSDLRTFGPLLDPEWVEPLRDELRWLGGELGLAREAEVLLGHLRDHARTAGTDIERDAQPLLAAAVDEHRAAQLRVVAAMDTSRYLDLVDLLVQGAMAPRFRPSAAEATTRDLVRLARRPWRRLTRAYKALGPEPTDAALHALRIRTKRTRYAVEAVAGAVGGEKPRKFATALTGLQDVLGAHQDAAVALIWVHDQMNGPHATASNREAYAAGVLAGLLRADELAARDALPAAWHRASRPRLRAFL